MIKKGLVLLRRATILALVLLILMVLYLYTRPLPTIQNASQFEEMPIKLADFGLFDLGVTDVNQDTLLDVFTENHSGRQSVLINQGQGRYTDEFFKLKLDQDHEFPGLAVVPKESVAHKPGIYINWQGPTVVVRAYKMNSPDSLSGTIEILSPIIVEKKDNANVVVKHDMRANGVTHTIIEFHGGGDSYFAFKPYLHALPIRFKFTSDISPGMIFVGPHYVSPSSVEFSMNMRDRHGMAWADYNKDGLPDLFITRGGQKGWMGRMTDPYWDELFVSESGVFRNIGEEVGLLKDDCSGRQAAWIDYNADSRLDLYVSCGKPVEYQANKLFEQKPDGHFTDVAKEAGLDMGPEGSFVWLDADSDGDMDLFWADARAFYLYENVSGKFISHRLGANPARHISKKLTVADFDMDGDLDIFAAAPEGNSLCINMGGGFIIADPVAWGLPKKSKTANWVDYDNDGLLDLHAIPDGIYKQDSPGKFTRTSILSISNAKYSYNELNDALVSWFDMNNDGMRDLVMGLDYSIRKRRWATAIAALKGAGGRLGGLHDFWKTYLLRNDMHPANHWLEIELQGLPGNRPGIGSVVRVIRKEAGQQMQQVGVSEGSRYSQGHYRLYFGLGKTRSPVTVQIRWPDGYSQEIGNVETDRLFIIKRENSKPAGE